MPVYDLILHGGMIVDGTRLPRYRADIGIKHDRTICEERTDWIPRELNTRG